VHLPNQKSLGLRVRLETLRARSPKMASCPANIRTFPVLFRFT